MSNTSAKILKYTLLPGLIPRFMTMFSSGFVHIAYLMAIIYESLKLLPSNHPYLNPANKGRYGMRHVISEAANNLVFSKKNIDQILIFFLSITGLVILFSQLILFVVSLVLQQEVLAQSLASIPTLLTTSSPFGHGGGGHEQDLSFIILDRVFGVPGIFESCISTAVPCTDLENNALPSAGAFPSTFHLALHQLLNFYSVGLFLVSAFIILYFFVAVLAETAATGTPFGQRTNKAWAPVRLILFFAMLAPLGGGLNGAQLITLWTAKIGSNFASNGWGYFEQNLENGTFLESGMLLASPTLPSLSNIDLMTFMYVAKTCKIVEEKAAPIKTGEPIDIKPYIVSPDTGQKLELTNTTFANAVNRTATNGTVKQQGSVFIAFGYHATDNGLSTESAEQARKYIGHVYPICGKMAINVKYPTSTDIGDISAIYFKLLQEMWNDTEIASRANCMTKHFYMSENEPECTVTPDNAFARERHTHYNTTFRQSAATALQNAQDEIVNNPDPNNTLPVLREKGWAGAALWYNRIAEINGKVAEALHNAPTVTEFPMVMQTVLTHQKAQNQNVSSATAFKPELPGNATISYEYEEDRKIAAILYRAYKIWKADNLIQSSNRKDTGNILIDGISALLGTSGIFNMRANVDVHPLAQLSSLGKSMLEASITNLGLGMTGMLAGKVKNKVGPEAKKIGSALWSLGLAVMLMSVILFYILPFLPFMYFLFAISGWIKSIFEAVVAMPLWAMAHIRIDGEGIPGRDASNGYYLLLEIFLRPILIVFGLLASIVIFSAMVQVLNDIFDVVVTSVGGYDRDNQAGLPSAAVTEFLRSPVDEIFYTVVYVILTYMMGLASFKLIDMIPNQILRWIGASVSTIQEDAGDPAGKLSGSIYKGGSLMLNQAKAGGQLIHLI